MYKLSIFATALFVGSSFTSFAPINVDTATHIPTYINTTASGAKVALYNNIRFAQPPIGNLRFRKPRTPPPTQDGIQDGRDRLFSSDCVCAAPSQVPFPGLNGTTWGTEDCLFLNVWVPEGVKAGDNVPVLYWMYGSAYAFGSKDLLVDGMGLMDLIRQPQERFIYVSGNYRMGIYGWTSSADEDMDANVGLHDGIAALEWTKQYIARFGGNPNDITVLGESAGAAMVELMLVAEEGMWPLPFQKAFISSPALLSRRNVTARREYVWQQVLNSTNCSSLDCMRQASPSTLEAANKNVLLDIKSESGGGSFGPGMGISPFPDGKFITDAAMVLFKQGKYNRQLKSAIIGNMAAEGLITAPEITTPSELASLIRLAFPNANASSIRALRKMYLYPDSELLQVGQDWVTDAVFACNAEVMAKAYGPRAQRYVFSIPPAAHGQDLEYIFFRDNTTTPVSSPTLARQFQQELLSFVRYGAGNSSDWPLYGNSSNIANVTMNGLQVQKDPWAEKPTCEMIMQLLEDRASGA
ncbi:hypothetical protein N7532_004707 [Penicillium argentinense]|uniref:Carboxylic ester hydrolase n=1 Tax=Penicillium argentinense TaxID=1131581 RepID=A0A9W9FPY4_9EURO|nr:uncharacterized protein N7532_004707 [Penicillium argentinense]KAJ5104178.1 hypothetical protein N7532_004707 [Penicillium argentinense]